jgi:hypothetical protein
LSRTKSWLCAVCFLVTLLLIALPSEPSARAAADAGYNFCACCATAGEWFTRQEPVTGETLSDFGRLGMAGNASLSMSEAGADGVRGISDALETYALTVSRNGRRWTLRLRGEGGKEGTLSFDVPRAATVFGVDLRDGQQGGGGGPLLYKEWRIEGPLTGTGVFRQGAGAGTRFRLVLQGRGNMCTNAADYKNWTLQVSGPRSRYSFYGTLGQTP